MVFEAVLQLLHDFGFFGVVLPFLLIFSIFYAILSKTRVLGDPKEDPWVKGTVTVISMVVSFLVISYTPVVNALQTLIPQAAFLLVVLMLFLMMVAFIVPDFQTGDFLKNKWIIGIIGIIMLVIFLAIVGVSVGGEIPALHGLANVLLGNVPLQLTEGAINMLIAFAIIIGIPLVVVAMLVYSGKNN